MTTKLDSMPWRCRDCRGTFHGPTDHKPEAGCPFCGSGNIIDINTTPVVTRLRPHRPRILSKAPAAIPPSHIPPATVAALIRDLRVEAGGRHFRQTTCRALMTQAAAELERLSQLPLL